MGRHTDPTDPQAELLYRVEDQVLGSAGRRYTRWRQVEERVQQVVLSPQWLDAPGDPPIDVQVQRRSRSARSAVASSDLAVIWIPDGAWTELVLLHELAHLVAPDGEPHGPEFVAAELWLIRWAWGFHEYAALRSAFRAAGVRGADAEPFVGLALPSAGADLGFGGPS